MFVKTNVRIFLRKYKITIDKTNNRSYNKENKRRRLICKTKNIYQDVINKELPNYDMKKITSLILISALLLCSCTAPEESPEYTTTTPENPIITTITTTSGATEASAEETTEKEAEPVVSETEDTERYFAAFNVKTKEWTIYGRKYSTYMSSKSNNYANNSIRFVDCASDDENAEEIISYFTVGDNGLSKFVPEEIPMERDIYISSGGRFILTAYETEDRERRIKLYDVETGEVLLSKVTYFYVNSAYIDEGERRLYVVSDDVFMMDF